MKSLSIALVFTLSLTFALADPPVQGLSEKEQKAVQECNATIPVQKNPGELIGQSIMTGERVKLSHEDKCFLNCYLQKVGFLDNDSNIRNGSGLVRYTVKEAPEFARYSDVLIALVFQISRSTKGFDDDKCPKAFVTFHQFAQGIFTLEVAHGLESSTGVKDKIVNAVENGQKVDQELKQQVELYLKFITRLMSSLPQAPQKTSH